jgi:hypothetical protein
LFYRTSFLSKITNPEPPKYKLNSATDNKICVTGSVEGVIIAATIVQITITYFHADSIRLPDTISNKPKTTCIAGTWNANPVANNKTAIKSKYWSNDQKGSTISAPYEIKNLKAAGTRKK